MTKRPYAVGFGKPPTASQFKPGRSGNPKGRPSGHKNLKTILEEELHEKIEVTDRGKRRKLTKQQIVVKQTVKKAMEGDLRATNLLANLIFRLLDPNQQPPETIPLSAEDQNIIDNFLKKQTQTKPQPKRPRNRERTIRSKGA